MTDTTGTFAVERLVQILQSMGTAPLDYAQRFALLKAMTVERIFQLLKAFNTDRDGFLEHLPNVQKRK